MKLAITHSLALFVTFFGINAHVLADGGIGSGGGNTVGNELFDDFENQGTEVISVSEITGLVKPQLDQLAVKIPAFAEKLSQGIKGTIWYKEPKTLNQEGACKNGSDAGISLTVQQVVRACQSSISVRIDRDWYNSKPAVLPGLVFHELLVYQRLHQPAQGTITEEAELEVSRQIRNPNKTTALSSSALRDLVNRAGFGNYAIPSELKSFRDFEKSAMKTIATCDTQIVNYQPEANEAQRGAAFLRSVSGFTKIFNSTTPDDIKIHEDELGARMTKYFENVCCGGRAC